MSASVRAVFRSSASGIGSTSATKQGVSVRTASVRPRSMPSAMTRIVLVPGCFIICLIRQTVPTPYTSSGVGMSVAMSFCGTR